MSPRAVWTIAAATLHESLRRRILLAAVGFGAVFVILFGFGFAAVRREILGADGPPSPLQPVMLNFFIMAGLYAVNFLTVLTAACLPVDTMSGEIASGVMQTVAAKPISRATIVLGKWLGHAIVLLGYLALIAGGLLLVARALGGVSPPNLHVGLPLLALEGLIMLTLSIALGTRVSTIANAVTCIGLYGLAFLGGWFEQVGTLLGTPGAGDVGVVASLDLSRRVDVAARRAPHAAAAGAATAPHAVLGRERGQPAHGGVCRRLRARPRRARGAVVLAARALSSRSAPRPPRGGAVPARPSGTSPGR